MVPPSVRIAHFSDVHLTAKPLGWRPGDLVSKRLTGWINVKLLGRGRRFKHAPEVVEALMRELRERDLDGLVFTGDATKLAFESEVVLAGRALQVTDNTLPPGIAVPGNHDYYTPLAAQSGVFEREFASWQTGTRVDSEPYPFARQIGPVWFIAVNSCTANRFHMDASGAIGGPQLERLRKLCEQLSPGPRVLVTHYPLRTETGQLETRLRVLRDHTAALQAAIDCRICLWLHGHIHRGFVRGATDDVPFPLICAGSATQNNRMMYNEYLIDGNHLTGVRRVYDLEAQQFFEVDRFTILLPAHSV